MKMWSSNATAEEGPLLLMLYTTDGMNDAGLAELARHGCCSIFGLLSVWPCLRFEVSVSVTIAWLEQVYGLKLGSWRKERALWLLHVVLCRFGVQAGCSVVPGRPRAHDLVLFLSTT